MNRRQIFASAAGLLLPFQKSWASTAQPKRVIIFYFPDGVPGITEDGGPSLWHATGSEYDFALSEQLSALTPFRDRCLFMNGITMDPQQNALRHHPIGAARLLTATPQANHISIDQLLARSIGAEDPWPLIYLGVQTRSAIPKVAQHLSYPLPKISVPSQDDPAQAMCDLFLRSSTAQSCRGNPQSDAKALDIAMTELLEIKQRLSGSEAQKIDFHLESLHELRKRTDLLPQRLETYPQCSDPQIVLPDTSYGGLNLSYMFPELLKSQIDIMVLAMECNISHVGLLQCSHHTSDLMMNQFVGSEMYEPGADLSSHNASHYGSPADQSNMHYVRFYQQRMWYMQQFVYLLDQLDSRPEGDGTMLDHSMVLLCSEISDGNTHSLDNMPFLLAGGAYDGGRLLSFERAPHGRLLFQIAQKMGADISSFAGYNSPLFT